MHMKLLQEPLQKQIKVIKHDKPFANSIDAYEVVVRAFTKAN